MQNICSQHNSWTKNRSILGVDNGKKSIWTTSFPSLKHLLWSLISFKADFIGALVLKAEYYLSDSPSCTVANRETWGKLWDQKSFGITLLLKCFSGITAAAKPQWWESSCIAHIETAFWCLCFCLGWTEGQQFILVSKAKLSSYIYIKRTGIESCQVFPLNQWMYSTCA